MKKKIQVIINGQLSDWKVWWGEISPVRRYLPVALVAGYIVLLYSTANLNKDHILSFSLLLFLVYGGPRLKSILAFLLPLLLTATIYDSQRFYVNWLRGKIHVSEPYMFDKRFFSIESAGQLLTPNEWWQQHTHAVLDFITGIGYLTYLLVFVLVAAYFFFWISRRGTSKMSAEEVLKYSRRIMWAFFWVNIIGYITYYVYPAAPPWYVTEYGLVPPVPGIPSNPAGCARFDQLLGTSVFAGMYGKSANVFGAIPSLHVAYPLLGVYYAFRIGKLRIFTVLFYLLVVFSAVYLNHHYLIDIMLGSFYALMIPFSMDLFLGRKNKISV